ncbi:hypothetical protein LXL04_031348 [Taraxacum kok-saghyz]
MEMVLTQSRKSSLRNEKTGSETGEFVVLHTVARDTTDFRQKIKKKIRYLCYVENATLAKFGTKKMLEDLRSGQSMSAPRRGRADLFRSTVFEKTNSLRGKTSACGLHGADISDQEALLAKNKHHLSFVKFHNLFELYSRQNLRLK